MNNQPSIRITLIFAIFSLFALPSVAEQIDEKDHGEQSRPVDVEVQESVSEPAEAEAKEPGAGQGFLGSLADFLEKMAVGAMDQKARELQGFSEGEIDPIRVVEERGNSVTVDIPYRKIAKPEGVLLKVNVVDNGFASSEFSGPLSSVQGTSGTARVKIVWLNPMSRPEFKSTQLKVVLYRAVDEKEEEINTVYSSLEKTWTPFGEIVDSLVNGGVTGTPADVVVIGESPTGNNGATQSYSVVGVFSAENATLSGSYTIQQKSNNRYLDAHESAQQDHSVVTRTNQKNTSQVWIFQSVGNNAYTIRQKSNNRYLDAHESAQQDYSVVTRTNQNNTSQVWIFQSEGNNAYTIRQKSNGRYMDAHVGSNDHSVVTRGKQNDDTQRWIVKPL